MEGIRMPDFEGHEFDYDHYIHDLADLAYDVVTERMRMPDVAWSAMPDDMRQLMMQGTLVALLVAFLRMAERAKHPHKDLTESAHAILDMVLPTYLANRAAEQDTEGNA